MLYYAVVYMTNGEIHLKPYNTKQEAESHCKDIKGSEKWGSKVEATKVVTRDPESPWFKKAGGHWI